MPDSTVFKPGQSLRRREMMRAAAAGTAAFGMGAASSGTVAADDDDGGSFFDHMPEPSTRHVFVNPGLEALYNYVTPLWDDGFTEESVEEMSESNFHLRVWQAMQTNVNSALGTLEQLENFIRPDDPLASPLAEMAQSVLRTTALQAVQDGESVTEARLEGENAALDELSTTAINIIEQINAQAMDYIQYSMPYIPEEELVINEFEHSNGETYKTFEQVDIVEDPDGVPPINHVLSTRTDNLNAHWERIALHTDDYILPNGDPYPFYQIQVGGAGSWSGTYDVWTYTDSEHSNDTAVLTVRGPNFGEDDSEYIEVISYYHPWRQFFDAIEQIASEIQSEAGDAIEEIMDAYNAGDVDDMDVLSSYDLVREYNDSDAMTRYTAELLAAGLDAQEDISQQVTIDHSDTGERTGRLFLSWNWDELADWEYSYDAETQTLEIATDSIDAEPSLIAVFDDDGTEVTIPIEDDDLDGDSYEFAEDNGTLEAVEVESEGLLHSHIPVGTTTDHWESAYFIHETDTDANLVHLDPAEPFELVAVEDDGEELDALHLEGWNNQTRDPARSLEEAKRAEEQFMTLDDLEETAHGGGGGGTDTNALLIGGGIIALIGMIIAALSSGGS